MATVTFSGTVSAQAASGEAVTITVTKPGNTTETLTATTLADKTFSTTKDYLIAGSYITMFHIDADATYSAADAGPVSFTITLQTRMLTVSILKRFF